MGTITWSDFEKIDLRIGTIVQVNDFPEARQPAYQLRIDLGAEIGVKKSSAQITGLYTKDDLLGKQVVCVINFPPKQIGKFMSEVLVTGFGNESGQIVLTSPDTLVANGSKMH